MTATREQLSRRIEHIVRRFDHYRRVRETDDLLESVEALPSVRFDRLWESPEPYESAETNDERYHGLLRSGRDLAKALESMGEDSTPVLAAVAFLEGDKDDGTWQQELKPNLLRAAIQFRASPKPSDAHAMADGPHEGNLFIWKGVPSSVEPLAWRYLQFVGARIESTT